MQLNSKKIIDNRSYIVGDRSENTFSLTASLTASALGAWILFGPASASTWGGIGAVIGYALGTAAPMLFLYNFGPKIRKEFPKGLTLTEFIKKRFGIGILKICLFLILFYLTIFLIAEVTAIAALLKYTSSVPLWITAAITLIICLLYILRGGFKIYNKQIIKVMAAVIHKGTLEVYFKRAAMAVTSAIKNIVK
jgi:Na+/proline symporter